MNFILKIDTLNKKLAVFFLITSGLAFCSGIYGYKGHSEWPPVRSDGEGYYSYLPTMIIYKSFDFSLIEKSRFQNGFPDWTGIRLNKNTGRLHNQYPMGVAILISPFFLVAHIFTSFFKSLNSDGYSLLYQISVLTAAWFYYLLGTYFLAKYLANVFNERIAFLTVIFITFGTSLFHYATYDAIFSHIYSYCFVVLLIYLTEKFWQNPTFKDAIILGGVIGVLFLIRNYNLALASFFFLYPFGKEFKKIYLLNAKPLALVIGTSFATILPQLIIWKVNAGSFIVYSYLDQKTEGARFNWLTPKLVETISSVQAGVFIWAPILLIGFIGLLLLLRSSLKKIAALSLINICFLTYLVASFWTWHFGGGYGHRGFVDIYPFFAIGIAGFLSAFKKPYFLNPITGLCWVFTLLVSIQMFNYWKGKIDYFKPTWEQYFYALKNFPRLAFVELLPNSRKSLTVNEGLFAKGAIIIPPEPKIKVKPNASFIIKVMIKNAGYSYWLPPSKSGNVYGAVSLGGQWYFKSALKTCKRPNSPSIMESRITLWDIVSPNEWIHFEEFIKAPSASGSYYYMLSMVSERVVWFDQISNSFVKCIEVKVE